jgi:DNA-binding transcriptional LysR family regulator
VKPVFPRNVSRASRALHISQPAVSKQIMLLEKEYNAKLFTRGGRGVELTERGKVFLRDVRRLIKQYEKLKEKFGAITSESSVQALTVGGSYSPSVSFLPSLLAGFEKSHPNVRLNLRTDNI